MQSTKSRNHETKKSEQTSKEIESDIKSIIPTNKVQVKFIELNSMKHSEN